MTNITIKEGTYKIRGKDVDLSGMTFPLVEEFKVGARGGYVTVDGTAIAGFPDRNIKIMCDSADAYEVADSQVAIAKMEETDDLVSSMLLAIRMIGVLRDWDPRIYNSFKSLTQDEDYDPPMPIFISNHY